MTQASKHHENTIQKILKGEMDLNEATLVKYLTCTYSNSYETHYSIVLKFSGGNIYCLLEYVYGRDGAVLSTHEKGLVKQIDKIESFEAPELISDLEDVLYLYMAQKDSKAHF
jgi:hypothetical protein